MIQRAITRDELLVLIDAYKPRWRETARPLEEANASARRHIADKNHNIWSDIKPIFVEVQLNKCAYCERRPGESGIEWDVEHFRPKGSVATWTAATFEATDIGGESTSGYYWLAFEPRNYLAACKTCNTIYKHNYFPTAGRRSDDSADVSLSTERPYLPHPLDPQDTDPQDLITFLGTTPQAVFGKGFPRERALVTIEVLGLAEREDLLRERCEVITGVWLAHRDATNDADDLFAHNKLAYLRSAPAPHSSCASAFADLCKSDRDLAQAFAEDALEYLMSHVPDRAVDTQDPPY